MEIALPKWFDNVCDRGLASIQWFVAVIHSCASRISRVAVGYGQSDLVALLGIDFNLLARSEPSEHET
jgi:hypothetical protein